ncbi:hypothetical protein [Phyllobacterium sp. OV277]|uniref:hypothetical protein n=1 Tax=Phyllobacterium sp. OV277 TaxID=1882772 RepID=UPI000890C8A5|nr:hypothetical protein [Phyllobacterium sp. OV277]SDO17727.1 hypothetical protein SAMN05443582_1011194 [Phyllobacterium sp. OV277]
MHKIARRLRMFLLLPVVTGVLALGACRDSGEGDYLAVAGKLFVFNYRIAQATYHLTLTKVRRVPDEAMLETTFENPAGGEPLIVRQKVWPAVEKIGIDSPPIKCVKAGREYKVIIRLEDAGGKLLQTIDRTMISDTDQSVMPDKPLVVGPFYDPNPDKDKPDPTTIACPA